MRRILLNLGVGLGMLTCGTAAYAQHGHGGHGGGHGGHGGGFGGHPGMHAPAMPMRPAGMHAPSYPGPRPISSPRPARPAPLAGRPQGPRGALPVRPATRPSSGRTPMASARPATGRAPSNRQPASVSSNRANAASSSRRPASLQTAHTGANNKAHAQGLTSGQTTGQLSNNTRSLTTADNAQLITLQSTLSSAQSRAGITAALDGKPMSTTQVNALRATLNSSLPASDKSVIAKALQTDQQIKRQQATNNAINGLATGSLLGGLGGNGGGLGGLGGNGGGSGGLGGNGGGSGGSCGGDDGGSSSSGGGGGGYPSGGDGDASSPIIASGPVGGAPSPAPAYASGAESAPAEEDEGGVRLQAVEVGAAAERAGLRAGDVILSFGEFRTRNFEELQAAVRQAGGPVKVIFINGENGATEYLTVEAQDGRIGVTCE